jgi:hypothetical protein
LGGWRFRWLAFGEIIIYLTPCVPLSFKGEGEKKKRGVSPLLKTPRRRELKRDEVPLTKNFPLPLTRGEG